ncbi:hypothetical protein HMPREF0493_0189 [Lactobacillus amylolyticus DSM 11664]|uniref:Uncharacterized protein n=1 Tax=Lactobacillus amylolyticus DSM 11664 TaxID=585524 RepID=D4YRR1_9LACO|nr:hypothetical protein HMPREF0493_0189 [Lactobacillus amylolyticus DSM 11664]
MKTIGRGKSMKENIEKCWQDSLIVLEKMKECDVWSECFLNYTTPSLDVSTTQSKNAS